MVVKRHVQGLEQGRTVRAERATGFAGDGRAWPGAAGAQQGTDRGVKARRFVFHAERFSCRADFITQTDGGIFSRMQDPCIKPLLDLLARQGAGSPPASCAGRAHVFQVGPRR